MPSYVLMINKMVKTTLKSFVLYAMTLKLLLHFLLFETHPNVKSARGCHLQIMLFQMTLFLP